MSTWWLLSGMIYAEKQSEISTRRQYFYNPEDLSVKKLALIYSTSEITDSLET